MTVKAQITEISYNSEPLRIEYIHRPGEKETLLYFHGLGCSKSDFLGAYEYGLLNHYTLIAFDFPGHGNSAYIDDLDIDDLVEITGLFIEKLNLKDLVLIGHSMGGLIALLYCDRYDIRVKAFINVEGNLASEDCTFSRQAVAVDYDTFMKETFRNFRILLQFNKKPGFKKCAETLQRYYPVNAMYDYSPSLVWYSDSGEMVNKFTSLNVSSCFIHGSENNRLSYIPELKQKGIPVFEISDSNHFPQYDNPEEYYRILAGFVDSLQ